MMYSLGPLVLPVDTHNARVVTRLKLVPTVSAAAIDRDVSVVVPPARYFDFHANAVAHGCAVCCAVRPRCDRWVVPPTDCPEADERDSGNRGHERTSDKPLDPPILAVPAHVIPPRAAPTAGVRNGEYTTDAPLVERDQRTEVVAEPIDTAEVTRPFRVLGLAEE